MSLHKLTAGAGYDYLTRQVAALDSTEKGHTGLASYYTERGETPGVWIGSGSEGIDGLTAGDPVTVEQMRALFGCGLHPLAELRQQQLEGPDLTQRDYQDAARLGAPFKIVDSDVSPFRLEVARRIAAINSAAGLPAGAPRLPTYNTALDQHPGLWECGSGSEGDRRALAASPTSTGGVAACPAVGLHRRRRRPLHLAADPRPERASHAAARLGAPFRSLTATSAHFGSRSPGASPRSTARPACRPALRCDEPGAKSPVCP